MLSVVPIVVAGCTDPGAGADVAGFLANLGDAGHAGLATSASDDANQLSDPNIADPNGLFDDDPNDFNDDHGMDPNDVNDDHGGDESSSPNGNQLRLGARLVGVGHESGSADYRLESNRERFKVEVEHFVPNTTHDIFLNGQLIGQVDVGPLGTGEVEFDTKREPGHIPLPSDFPVVVITGDVVSVGNLVSGSFVLDH